MGGASTPTSLHGSHCAGASAAAWGSQRVYEDDEDEPTALQAQQAQQSVEGVEVPPEGESISERVGLFEEKVLPKYKTATVEAWAALKARWAEENANRLDTWSAIGSKYRCPFPPLIGSEEFMQDTNLECLEEWESSHYDSDGSAADAPTRAGPADGGAGGLSSRSSLKAARR